jgi:hypothetical protein
MSRRAPAAACLVLALGFGAAGCGDGGGKRAASRPATTAAPPASAAEVARYRSAVSKLLRDFADGGRRLRDAVGPRTGSANIAAAYTSFHDSTNAVADALSRLHPPPSVVTAQGQLVATLRAIATVCRPVIDAGKAGDRQRLRSAVSAFQRQVNGPLGSRAQDAATRIDAGLARA